MVENLQKQEEVKKVSAQKNAARKVALITKQVI